ncbi:MAG TPA: DUF2076 family protein [Devosiaceae bacterium]|jgi:hypothetical protein
MLNREDREAIDTLFERLEEVERNNPDRDREAERLIAEKLSNAPHSPYYLAQTVVVQERALAEAEQRIAELERQARGATRQGRTRGPWDQDPDYGRGAGPGAGGGFLAGAAQTALGVTGGVLLGSLLGGLFSAGSAQADDGDRNRDDDRSSDDDRDDRNDDQGNDDDMSDGGDDNFDTGGDF